MEYLPGTILPWTSAGKRPAFSLLDPIFAVSGEGLLLSQITSLTGLSAPTVQNWVKRGWVSNPVNKRYSPLHVARILLINLLRPAMRLEQIAAVLTMINGSVDNRADDIIPETKLYNDLCDAILALDRQKAFCYESVASLVDEQLKGYEEPVPGAKARLSQALTLMLLNIAAANLMQRAEGIYASLQAETTSAPTTRRS